MPDFDWRAAIHEALRAYHDLEALQQSQLRQLRLVDALTTDATTPWLTVRAVGLAVQTLLDRALAALTEARPQAADLLRKRFLEDLTTQQLHRSQGVPISTLNDHQRRALEMLAAIIIRWEAEEEAKVRRRALALMLPAPSYQQLVGFEPYLQELRHALSEASAGQPLFITGLGGIGKTSLTREALLTWLQDERTPAERVFWVAVVQATLWGAEGVQAQRRSYALDQVLSDLGKQMDEPVDALSSNERRLRALAKRLQEAPTIVVIDNIETPEEAQVALTLAETFGPVAQVITTSRRRLELPTGRLITLSELPQPHALQLLALECQRLNSCDLSESLGKQIFGAVGGNPLALKLVAAQLALLPARQVLAGFEKTATQTTQELFAHIYDTAWRLLTPAAQQALLAMFLLPAAGATWEGLRLAASAGAPPDDAWLERVIAELTGLNLVQVGHNLDQTPTYSLHRLTYAFLAAQLGMQDPTSLADL
jgi:ABC-type transport system involved in cytochrome c biogenesis ATPase subunit